MVYTIVMRILRLRTGRHLLLREISPSNLLACVSKNGSQYNDKQPLLKAAYFGWLITCDVLALDKGCYVCADNACECGHYC